MLVNILIKRFDGISCCCGYFIGFAYYKGSSAQVINRGFYLGVHCTVPSVRSHLTEPYPCIRTNTGFIRESVTMSDPYGALV